MFIIFSANVAESNGLIIEQTSTVIPPVSKKLQAFSLQPSLELTLLLSELNELLKLQPVNVKKSTNETVGKTSTTQLRHSGADNKRQTTESLNETIEKH